MEFLGLFDETEKILGIIKRFSEDKREFMIKAFVADLLWTWKNGRRLLNVVWIKRNGLPYSGEVERYFTTAQPQTAYPKYFDVIQELTKNIEITEYTIEALLRKLPDGKEIKLEGLKRSWK